MRNAETSGAFKKIEENQLKGYTNVYPLATLVAMKDSGLRIRVQRELRQSFLEACQAEDTPAAQVLRDFMRAYVRKHQEAKGKDAGGQLNINEPPDQER